MLIQFKVEVKFRDGAGRVVRAFEPGDIALASAKTFVAYETPWGKVLHSEAREWYGPAEKCPVCQGRVVVVLDNDGERSWVHKVIKECGCEIEVAVGEDGKPELAELTGGE